MNERIVILGGGESGVGAAILAQQKGYEVFLSDGSNLASERRRTLKSHKIDFEEGAHSEELILNATLVVKSPGIPDSAPLIKKLVAAENRSKPLSDSKIAELIAEQGIKVARRTIAKYRESLNIPSSSQRKSLL